jgi:orotidine-5'-phosphate decarboxylase
MSIDSLISKIKSRGNSPIVVGLDPQFKCVPREIKAAFEGKFTDAFEFAAACVLEFNKKIIDAVYDIAPAVKPQSAYYEIFGAAGVRAFDETIKYARSRDMYVIADVKRGDIGATSEAYARAYLGAALIDDNEIRAFDADSITVNPYFGIDGAAPFLEMCRGGEKSVFALVKTSNKSSIDIQDLVCDDGELVYEKVAKLVDSWGAEFLGESGYSNLGAVVGATHPECFVKMRAIMRNSFFLVPGYGAQGGTAKDLEKCFNQNGFGAIVNSSRGIIFAYEKTGENFQTAARNATIKMRDEIRAAIT